MASGRCVGKRLDALNGLASSYLSDLVNFYVPERDLRSSSQKLLAVPFSDMK